jgi:hypothetical protein
MLWQKTKSRKAVFIIMLMPPAAFENDTENFKYKMKLGIFRFT